MNGSEILRNICGENNFTISDLQILLLEKYVALFGEWNEKINLMSRKDIDNIRTRHIIGSIAFLFQNSIAQKCNIVDVGTGGGLPGIPLAILLPDCKFTLVDSIRKKINAVEAMVKSLSLANVRTLLGRAEELSAKPEYRKRYDYVIARAVGSASDLINWSSGFLRQKEPSPLISEKQGSKLFIFPGTIILMKGGDLSEEISNVKKTRKSWTIETYPMDVKGVPPEDLQDKKFILLREGK